MKKAQLLAPKMATREMVDGPDLERMLASGSWVIATIPKKPTARAKTMRQFRSRRLAAGYRRFEVLLPEHIYNALHALRQDGETFVKLFERLLSGDVSEKQ